ncbi:MAG: toxin-antitoxin system YwqK family antitoxin [Opitutales bacterium]
MRKTSSALGSFFIAIEFFLTSCVTPENPEPVPEEPVVPGEEASPEVKILNLEETNPLPVVTVADLNNSEELDRLLEGAIHKDRLELEGEAGEELYYAPNPPYTGWAKEVYQNGQISALVHFKRGQQDGPWINWWGNGNKMIEGHFQEGKRHGFETRWYFENGQKQSRILYDHDKLISATAWKPSGEPCPHTNVLDGFGVLVIYHPNGQKQEQGRYKDGEKEGLWIYYNEDGTEDRHDVYEQGNLLED